ncbi:hypothetical protein Tco_0410793, partial [Tanacetum coccineum]
MIRWGPGLCVSQPDWSTVRPLPIGSSVSGKLLYFEQDNGGGYSIALQVHPFIFSLQLFKNLNDMEDQERAANVPGGHVKPALTFGQSAEIPAIKAKLYLPIHEHENVVTRYCSLFLTFENVYFNHVVKERPKIAGE